MCTNTHPLGVGAKHAPAERRTEAFFNGVLDDVWVYNRALSGAQIRALINLP